MATIDLISPMLATPGEPPTGRGWYGEIKWDGHRGILISTGDGKIRLLSRSGKNITSTYPELTKPGLLGTRQLILDGEVVAYDRTKVPDIGVLQRRMHNDRPDPRLVQRIPVQFIAFDVLNVEGVQLTGRNYRHRRTILRDLQLPLPFVVPPAYSLDEEIGPAELLDIAKRNRWEGIVAKHGGSVYESGKRSNRWIKTVLRSQTEVVICGWKASTNTARPLASLMMGAYYADDRLAYLGDVGSGMDGAMLLYLRELLDVLATDECPFDDRVDSDGARWVHPRLVIEIEYRTTTHQGRYRYASFRGLRADKKPSTVTLGEPK